MTLDLNSPIQNIRDIVGPTFVVADERGDFPLTEAGLNDAIAALPATGGKIAIGAGTLNITSPIVLPDKSVEFIGTGQSTILDLGSNAVEMFRIPDGLTAVRYYLFESLRALGDETVGQKFVDHEDTGGFGHIRCRDIYVTDIERVFDYTAYDETFTRLTTLFCWDSLFVAPNLVGAHIVKTIQPGGTFNGAVEARFFGCDFVNHDALVWNSWKLDGDIDLLLEGSQGLRLKTGSAFDGFKLTDSTFWLDESAAVTLHGSSWGTWFDGMEECSVTTNSADAFGTITFSSTTGRINLSGCIIRNIKMSIGSTGSRWGISNCVFQGTAQVAGERPDICLDIASTSTFGAISGCRFNGSITALIRLNGSTDWTVTGNTFAADAGAATVLEAGAANRNRFSNNVGFNSGAGPTIIGAASLVENENFRNVKTWGATGNGVTNDAAAIQAAINDLPVDGGVVYFPEGTYLINSTLTLPNKPVRIVGAGDGVTGATIISLGANTIAAFTFSNVVATETVQSIENLTVEGTGIAGQTFLDLDDGGSLLLIFTLTGVTVSNIETCFYDRGSEYLQLVNFDFAGANLTTTLLYNGPVANEFNGSVVGFNVTAVSLNSRNGVDNKPFFQLVDSLIDVRNAADFGGLRFSNVTFSSAAGAASPVAMAFSSQFSGCRFGDTFLELSGSENVVSGCIFQQNGAAPARRIDIAAAAAATIVDGCIFLGFTAEAIRTGSTGGIFTGNSNCEVLETGAADSNIYDSNDGFSPSTIIGPDSKVNGALKKGVAAGATTDAFVNQFTHTNPKGFAPAGSIKNTGAASMDVREEMTDAFGTVATITTALAAGGTLVPLTQLLGGAGTFPPYVSYGISVKSTAPGVPTTFDLQWTGLGAV